MSRHRNVRNISYDDYDDYAYDRFDYDEDEHYDEDENYAEADGGGAQGQDSSQRGAAGASVFGAFLENPAPAVAPAARAPAPAPAAPVATDELGGGERDERTGALRQQLLQTIGNRSWEAVGLSDAEVDVVIRAMDHDPALSLDAICARVTAKAEARPPTSPEGSGSRAQGLGGGVATVVPRPVRRKQATILDLRTSPSPKRGGRANDESPRGDTTPTMLSRDSVGNLRASISRSTSRQSLRTPSPNPNSALENGLDSDAPSDSDTEDDASGNTDMLSMVVIGHVDAGKSTLMGRLLMHTGEISARFVEKLKRDSTARGKSSFHFAWAMDEGDTEREHGVTMDVAQKAVHLPSGRRLTLLDAPGHADFVPRMIAGAAQADVALLVVPASTGEFEAAFGEGGQTREHALLARGMGVAQVLVAVNKLDLAEPAWSETRFRDIEAQIQAYLLSCGFKDGKIRFVPISGLTGVNVGGLTPTLGPDDGAAGAGALAEWYSGPTLVDALEGFAIPPRQMDKPFRFIVNDVLALGRDRARVSGVCVAGRVRHRSKLAVMPIGDISQLRKISRSRPKQGVPGSADRDEAAPSGEEDVTKAGAGDSLDLVLDGVEDASRIAIGSVLCKARRSELVPSARKVEVQMRIFDALKVPIIKGSAFMLHRDGKEVPCVVSKLLQIIENDGTVIRNRPRHILGNTTCRAQLRFDQTMCVEPYSECRALGRFALREKGDTVAAGIILDLVG